MKKGKIAKIIILAGQSNAVGVGHVKHLKDHFSAQKISEFEKGYENVLINFFSHDFGSHGFIPTTIGQTEINKHTVGPEVGIAEKLTEDFPGEKFFIVKYAIGGTCMYREWLSKTSVKEEKLKNDGEIAYGSCYNGFVKLLKKSIKLLKKQGYTPEIRALCWMQGESDAENENTMKEYPRRFDNFIKDFEKEFKKYFNNYVLADGGISDMWQFSEQMNDFKLQYAKTHKNGAYVDTLAAKLTTKNEPTPEPDVVHYDSDSIIKLGNLFEQAIKENLK
ncbi:MAG: sialate O-acetylesterase [Clostridia bacterium]|nr:sialate O-acetylesterase [Clostridia bacterium]